ncbi:MAG: hypothetical protein AB8B79_21035 [Granulosicoccus sp.]
MMLIFRPLHIHTLAALLLVQLSLGQVQARFLAPSEPVVLAAGSLLTHSVDWQQEPGMRIEIKLSEAPKGARLLVNSSGELYISWQTDLDMPQKSTFQLVARNIDTGQQLDTRELLVMREGGLQSSNAEIVAAPIPPRFSGFAQQDLQIGVPWQLNINPEGPGDKQLRILAKGLPKGAVMSLAPDGSYDIDWTPAVGQQGRRRVILRAFYAENPDVFTEQPLLMSVKAKPDPVEKPDNKARNRQTPRIAPLVSQIISAGRVVSFPVTTSIAGGGKVILQVDRLPRNASFDENKDGSRSFYWQTSDKDQGEHLFRFTAIHPRYSDLRAWREVLIVIGDPSRSSTSPADAVPGAIE